MKGKLAGVGSIVAGAVIFYALWVYAGMGSTFVPFIINCIGLAMIGLIILGIMLLIWA